MGRVYRAHQRGIDRDVAVKVLHRELTSNQALVARFDREAKVASRLAHPNVVHVLLVGQLPDGAMYIVMEYLDGLSLQSALSAADGAMPLPRALHVALQLCDAAGEGHARGIVHRDLKPENVMLVLRADDPDFVKVLDFGIARVHWGEPAMATAAGLVFGTARYISPEGAQGEQVTPAGDVYAIATMLYQMLSGRTPFNAEQAVAVLVQQIHDAPPPLRSLERSAYVPEAIAAVIMKNLSKRPEDRAPDARAFGRALLEAAITSGLSAQDVLARPSLLGGPSGPGHRAQTRSAVQMPSMERTRQLQLEPETAARIGAVTAFETPDPSAVSPLPPGEVGRAVTHTEVADPFAQPPGTATTRWSPQTKVLEGRPPATGTAVGVEQTMDDQHTPAPRSSTVLLAPSPLPAPAPPLASTQPVAPLGVTQAAAPLGTTQAAEPVSVLPVASAVAPQVSSRDADTTPPVMRASRTSRTPTPVSRSPSGVDATMADVDAKVVSTARVTRDRPVLRGAVVGVVCFAVGALGMIALASRGTLLSASRSAPSAEPSGVPVTPVVAATPEPAAAAALPPLDPVVPQRARGPAVGASAGSVAAGPARVVVDASNAKPGVGQPVDFEARVVGSKAKVDDARFLIAGPGVAPGTELPSADDGSGTFRTTFTFLQGGRFDVVFTARADKTPLRGARALVVGSATPTTPQATPDEATRVVPQATAPNGPSSAPPSASGNANVGANAKWL
jgi:serine/threonine protein kinase